MFERPFRRRAWPGSGLHVCSVCRSDFVHPTERRRESEARWRISLRCGQCGDCRDVVVGDDLVRRFDADVARGLTTIASDLDTLDRERMAAQVEAFTVALQRDLIDAGDFQR